MAVSRPLLLTSIAMLLLAATFYAARGAREGAAEGGQSAAEGGSSPAAETVAPAPATPAPAKTGSSAALPQAKPLKSGHFTSRLTVTGGRLEDRGVLDLELRFQSEGATQAPRFKLRAKSREPDETLAVGAVSLGTRGFLTRPGTAYAVPEDGWTQLAAMRSQVSSAAGGAGAGSAGSGPFGFDYQSWLSGVKTSPGPRIDGTETLHLSGRVDVRRAVEDLAQISRSKGDGGGPAFKSRQLQLARGALERSHLDLYVGKSDGIARRLRLGMAFTVPPRLRQPSGEDTGRLRFVAELEGANSPQRIDAPGNVKPAGPSSMPTELRKAAGSALVLGLVGIDLPGSAAARLAALDEAVPEAPGAGDAKARGVPRPLARALARRRVVVLFLRQHRGADDAATARAVTSIGDRKGVSVFRDGIDRVAKYRGIVSGLGVAQAPAVVIVGPDRRAQLVEGFVDEGTLSQLVVDAR